MAKLNHYVLSQAADQDLEDIFEYTEKEFGTQQAISYLLAIDELFKTLLENPELGRLRPELKPGLRSITKEAHVIFYTVQTNQIRIIRVLHGSRDMIHFIGEGK
ncbi:MAG: type II toxin-antitoxin system RelE/ParE family toxin [Flavobacteriaceae bacterium]|nr:type II toxin-antitoxin system RelE/ParE family toxin [Flavobacteriaceae bacterium]